MSGILCQITVTVSTIGDTGIFYHLNGGHFRSSLLTGDIFAKQYNLTHHLRANTSIGNDVCAREGYALLGWNTSPDGSGEHIGLGSRVTIPAKTTIDLYAEWVNASMLLYSPMPKMTKGA